MENHQEYIMLCDCETPQDYFEYLIQLKHIYLSIHVQHALFVSYMVKLFKVCEICEFYCIFINVPSKYNFQYDSFSCEKIVRFNNIRGIILHV